MTHCVTCAHLLKAIARKKNGKNLILISLTGNRTPVSTVTGWNTNHYTIKEEVSEIATMMQVKSQCLYLILFFNSVLFSDFLPPTLTHVLNNPKLGKARHAS